VAHYRDGVWRIAHFQNTRATFVGQPAREAALTAELQAVVDALGGNAP
jgi:hypothetical protein